MGHHALTHGTKGVTGKIGNLVGKVLVPESGGPGSSTSRDIVLYS